ncbi:MAG: hypothetical protein M3R25_06650 [Bacteroidota bacterium]|nr:hypothetical protein [Bacteroidota bacterium]
MPAIHPQFITDAQGKKVSVIISMQEFEALLEELEDIEDVKLYDATIRETQEEYITIAEYLKTRTSSNE